VDNRSRPSFGQALLTNSDARSRTVTLRDFDQGVPAHFRLACT
jgi:hypothetical protein